MGYIFDVDEHAEVPCIDALKSYGQQEMRTPTTTTTTGKAQTLGQRCSAAEARTFKQAKHDQ